MTINLISSIKNGFVNIKKNIKKKPLTDFANKLARISKKAGTSADTVSKFGMPAKLPSEISKKLAACAAGVGAVGVAGAVNSTTAVDSIGTRFDEKTALYSTTAVNSTTARHGLKSGVFSTTA